MKKHLLWVVVIALALTALLGITAMAADGNATQTFAKVTDVSTLEAGDKVIIAYTTTGFVLGVQNAAYRTSVEVTVTDDTIAYVDGITVLTLEKGTEDGTFAFNTGSGYLNYTGSKNTLTETATVDATASWTITADTITNVGTPERLLQYNTSSPRFACYQTSSKQQNVSVYKLVESAPTTTAAGAVDTTADAVTTTVGTPTTTESPIPTENLAPAAGDAYAFYYQELPAAEGFRDIRIICVINEAWITNVDSCNIEIPFYSASGAANKYLKVVPTTVYKAVTATVGENVTKYTALRTEGDPENSNILIGWVVKDVPTDYTPTGYSVNASITLETANKVGAALASGASTNVPYTVSGTIVKLNGKQCTIEDNGVTFVVYGEPSLDLLVGDTITATGKIMNYNGTTPEFNGYTLDQHLSHTHVGTAEYDAICEICGITVEHTCEDGEPVDAVCVHCGKAVAHICTDTNGDGLCEFTGKSIAVTELMDEAYALVKNTALSGDKTLTGEIVSIDTVYNPTYKNITVTITVEGDEDNREIQCYRMKGEGADALAVGDKITVTGTIKNYNGTIEFDTACTFVLAE